MSLLLAQPSGQLEARLGIADIPDPPAAVAVGVPAELLRRRPDVRAAELRAAAQSARVGVAEADKYPRFGLTGSLGLRSSDTGGSSIGDLFSSDSVEFIAGPIFSWPILNYGRIENAVRVQDAQANVVFVQFHEGLVTRPTRLGQSPTHRP